jgi:3-methyl-2-oxobutanoate hydroxymethyltransferase
MCSQDFLRAKSEHHKLSMVTCYDYTFARLLSGGAIDGILVGDSAAMVMHGHPSTLSMTIELMRLHTEAVVRGAGANSWWPTCRFSPIARARPRRSIAHTL